MNFIIIFEKLYSILYSFFPQIDLLIDIIKKDNGTLIVVGGCIRNILLDFSVDDIDIEVYGIDEVKLQYILSQFGDVLLIGKSFGVFKIKKINIDFSLPRKDGPGRKPIVNLDFNLSLEESFKRRDFTINAMGVILNKNIEYYNFIDPFNGLTSINFHYDTLLIPVQEETFTEDPLRFFRAMRYMSIYSFISSDSLANICSKMDISFVSKDRIYMEIKKIISTKIDHCNISKGFWWVKNIDRLKDAFPSLSTLILCEFNKKMNQIDEINSFKYDSYKDKELVFFSILANQVEKTKNIVNESIISVLYDFKGVASKKLIKQIKCFYEVNNILFNLEDMFSYKLIAYLLHKNNLTFSAFLPFFSIINSIPDAITKGIIAKLHTYNLWKNYEKPIVSGADLIYLVSSPIILKKILHKTYLEQLKEECNDKEKLLRYAHYQISELSENTTF